MSELKEKFLSASQTEKVAMLLALAVHLTILTRESYGPGNEIGEKYNETLHRLVSQALAMTVGSDKKYPDEVFVDMLLAGSKHKGISAILEQAFKEGKSMVKA